jgi:pyridinium-3,5-bisthiocarboxylic acid mononucleotide nickel chelatase
MLLAALHDLGALERLDDLLDSLADLGVAVTMTDVIRGGLRAHAAQVTAPEDQPHRRLRDVHAVIDAADVPKAVRVRARNVFARLAQAEAQVHGTTPDEVEFHEVGAVDSIIDVLACCLGFHTLVLDQLIVSPIALGGGTTMTAHGVVPVPTPAALALLPASWLEAYGGTAEVELATPTGIALLAEWADASGPMPTMKVGTTALGAGSRELTDRPNVIRLVLGEAAADARLDANDADAGWVVIEANVDDLDPRLWPGVIAKLLEAGAADAWLTPILMKKGRPAHTLSALTSSGAFHAVQKQIFLETSTIGVRWHTVGKRALDRHTLTVEVDGMKIRVKVAIADGRAVSATPEFDDVAKAAATLDVPVKELLREANRAVGNALREPGATELGD